MIKTKRVLLAVSITALIVTIILISLRAYYVTIALIVGTLLIGHRELWSLIRRRKLPPVDERVRENTSKSIRNGFIFLVIALAFLLLPFSVNLIETPNIVHILGGLFLSGGAVYLLSYLFYDQAEPKLDEKGVKNVEDILTGSRSIARHLYYQCLPAQCNLGLFIHYFGADFWDRLGVKDEPVFFFIDLLSIVAFAVGIIGSLVMFIKGLLSSPL